MFRDLKDSMWRMLRKENKSDGERLASKYFVEVVDKYIEKHSDKKDILRQKIPEDIVSQISSLA